MTFRVRANVQNVTTADAAKAAGKAVLMTTHARLGSGEPAVQKDEQTGSRSPEVGTGSKGSGRVC